MTYYELFQQGPAVYIPVLLFSLVVTIVAYGAVPFIVAKTRKPPITKKKYRGLCYAINVAVMFLFIVINGEASSGGPYLLWTWVFSSWGAKILETRGILVNSIATSNTDTPVASGRERIGKTSQKPRQLKVPLITAILSALFIPILIVAHVLAEEACIDIAAFYITNDILAFFVLPTICIVSLIIFILNKLKTYPSSLKYREKCYKKVAQMKEYLDKGIITEAEFEKNKHEILKNIRM